MTPSAQARSRAWEVGGVLALATLAGIAGGWAVSWLVVGPVGRAASTARPLSTPLTLDLLPWLGLLAVGAAAVITVVAVLTRTVRRQALDAEYREEVR
ncbi:MAG: hypothetical protein Q4G35_14190, partial [Propionibacteriaceae bacterium]|nr:hypothetical protein [Propionibacteriaceae bacterium]